MMSVFFIFTWCVVYTLTIDRAMCHINFNTVCVLCSDTLQRPFCDRTIDCHDLDQLPQVVTNFTEVKFLSHHSFLYRKPQTGFVDVYNLTLSGTNGSVINCNKTRDVGFVFLGVYNLLVKDLQFIGCGKTHFIKTNSAMSDSCDSTKRILGTLFLFNCYTVTLDNVHIRKRNGTGVVVFDTYLITMNNCTFESSNCSSLVQRGHGVYIEFGHCSPCITSIECANAHNVLSMSAIKYNFNQCRFLNNIATVHTYKEGGGLAVIFKQAPINITVLINDCKFFNNTAIMGGGLWILYNNNSQSNSTQSVIICKSDFVGNRATRGGGLSLSDETSQESIIPGPIAEFYNCTWKNNQAIIGAAVYSDQHHLTFLNSSFKCNMVKNKYTFEGTTYYIIQNGMGALFSDDSNVTFKGVNTFFSNNASAVYLRNSRLFIYSYSLLNFSCNNGIDGGALHLDSYSRIVLYNNVFVSFVNNSAEELGGALYQEGLAEVPFESKKGFHLFCVFTSDDQSNQQQNISFYFKDNDAGGMRYNSVFLPSLKPCCSYNNISKPSKECFKNIGNFSFSHTGPEQGNEISTAIRKLTATSTVILAIPGKKVILPVELKDELNQRICLDECTHVIILSEHCDTKIEHLLYLSCSEITFYGGPSRCVSLVVQKWNQLFQESLSVEVEVISQVCPPGYIFDNITEHCSCSVTSNSSEFQYEGILKCEEGKFAAVARPGYWVGYDSNKTESEESLILAHCPYCHPCSELPDTASRDNLNDCMCANSHRTGIVCGECKGNYTTLFHSENFNCYPNTDYCKFGILFYIFSEWLPVTILFTLATVLNISFTSGTVNGFVFFAQFISSTHSVEYLHLFNKSSDISKFSHSGLLMYKMFNLDFFSMDDLSFCIWQGAGALEVLAMKYVTIVYSFILVVLTIVALRKCKLPKFLRRSTKDRFQSFVVHGLSSFFVLCYSQCANTTINILTANLIKGKGDIGYNYRRLVVFFNGEMDYFRPPHLSYAIPALFFVFTFVLIPPILLIVYPLCYKLCNILKVSEKNVALCCRVIPLEKIRPLFDTMQSCFKDRCRYFSGLYFFYRLVPLLTFAWTKNTTYYGLLQLQLVIIFGLHSVIQPYKVRWHNWIDSLLFIDLLLINTLSVSIYLLANYNFVHDYYKKLVTALSSIQTLLTLLPLIYLILYLLIRMTCNVRNRFKRRRANREDPHLELSPLHSRDFDLSMSGEDFSVNYQKVIQ